MKDLIEKTLNFVAERKELKTDIDQFSKVKETELEESKRYKRLTNVSFKQIKLDESMSEESHRDILTHHTRSARGALAGGADPVRDKSDFKDHHTDILDSHHSNYTSDCQRSGLKPMGREDFHDHVSKALA